MASKQWTSFDQSRAAAIEDPVALAFVEQRIGENKELFDAMLFELLLIVAKARA